MKTPVLILLVAFISWAGVSTAQKHSRKSEKAAKTEQEFREVLGWVNNKRFTVKIDRVYPQSGHDVSRFNPEGYITVKDSIAEGKLPFFGRAYSLPYGEGGGIEFDGVMRDQKTKEKKRKKTQTVTFQFTISRANDTYTVSIEATAGGGCSVYVNSNQRAQISYSGTIAPLEDKNEKS